MHNGIHLTSKKNIQRILKADVQDLIRKSENKLQQESQCSYNVTLRRVRVTNVSPWKINKYYMSWVCVCSLGCPECIAYVPHCHLWLSWLNKNCPHYLISHTIFGQNCWLKICVLIFSTRFVWNIYNSERNWARYYQKLYWPSCKIHVGLVRF
jgi:hypothetical protein